MSRFKEYDVVRNPETGEEGTILMIFDKGEFDFYYIELSGESQGKLVSWCETGLELVWEFK